MTGQFPADLTPDGPAPKNARPPLKLVRAGKGAAQSPLHAAWLTEQAGRGPLAWMFNRNGGVTRVSCIGEDGYIEPKPRADGDTRAADENGPATVAPLTGRGLSTLLAKHYFVHVEHRTKEGDTWNTEEWFPVGDCDRVLEHPDQLPGVRPLRGVTTTPLLRAGGGLMTEPGYDDESGYLYIPDCAIPAVSAEPTDIEVKRATRDLRGLISEFGWASEHDEANYLGAMLTPLLKLVTPPPYKLVAIGAHQRGSGKSLLASLLRTVHGGTLRTWPSSEDERGKVFASILAFTTAPICQLDNIRGVINSAKLEALLTTDVMSERLLGSSNSTELTNDRLWVATGNNMIMGGDMDRRTLWSMIDPGIPNPEARTDFSIPNLSSHVAQHRGEILHNLLTLIAAWDAWGRPTGQPTSDDYGPWVAAVRGILACAEVPGVFDHEESRRENTDPADVEFGEFLQAIHNAYGSERWWTRDITGRMQAPRSPSRFDSGDPVAADPHGTKLYDAAPGELIATLKYGQPLDTLSKPLGHWLGNREGQWFGKYRVIPAGKKTNRGVPWMVETTTTQLKAV